MLVQSKHEGKQEGSLIERVLAFNINDADEIEELAAASNGKVVKCLVWCDDIVTDIEVIFIDCYILKFIATICMFC
jgi:hypothetical protein